MRHEDGSICLAGLPGETAAAVLRAWELQKPLLPPADWRAPPPAGFIDAQGMRRVEEEPWRPVRTPWTSQDVSWATVFAELIPGSNSSCSLTAQEWITSDFMSALMKAATVFGDSCVNRPGMKMGRSSLGQ